jgi:hypothetical protein
MVSVGVAETATRAALVATPVDKLLTRGSSRQVGQARLTADTVGRWRAASAYPRSGCGRQGLVGSSARAESRSQGRRRRLTRSRPLCGELEAVSKCRKLVDMQRGRHLATGDLCRESSTLGQGSRASLIVEVPRNEMAILIELVVHPGRN